MDVSVIITTYNHPQWLEKVLYGYAAQTHQRFEVVIADDGSDKATRSGIGQLRSETGLQIRHVWHEDQGFRKCQILNKAILQSSHDYLVFTDGDCVPRRDFLETHVRFAGPGFLLSGGIVRLPLTVSQKLTRQVIASGQATSSTWLRAQGMPASKKLWMLTTRARLAAFLDAITTTRATFNGHNTSAWKHDIISANGFDERMQYGGLDRELGERLANAGIRGRQIRHRAACLHLYHERSYVNAEGLRRNKGIRVKTVSTGTTRTEYGLDKYLPPRQRTSKLPKPMQPTGLPQLHGLEASLPATVSMPFPN